MKIFSAWLFPILYCIIMSISLFRYEKTTTAQNGSQEIFQIGGVESVIGVTVIVILIFMFYITNVLRKIVKIKMNTSVKFRLDILFLYAIGISILPHFVISDVCSDSDKLILVKYGLGITSGQNTKAYFIVVIAVLAIMARLYAITKSYWEYSQLNQEKIGEDGK